MTPNINGVPAIPVKSVAIEKPVNLHDKLHNSAKTQEKGLTPTQSKFKIGKYVTNGDNQAEVLKITEDKLIGAIFIDGSWEPYAWYLDGCPVDANCSNFLE